MMNKTPLLRTIMYTCCNCASNRIDPIVPTHVHCDDCGQSMDVDLKEYNVIYSFWLERQLRNPGVLKNLHG